MKYFFILALLTATQFLFAQNKGQVPQVNVLRYDTVITRDPNNANTQQFAVYNHNSGWLIKSGKFVDGKKEGVWKSYYENGMISRLEEYHNDEQNGTVITVEATGYVSKEDNIFNGVREGISREYNRNGTLRLEEYYTDGKLNGWRRVYSQEGKLQEEGNWRNGVRDSINRWAYPSGKIYVEYFYKNGNITGPGKLFYESGDLKAAGNYVEGYEEGSWKEYSDSLQEVTAEGSYTHGKKTGVWKIYNDDGTPQKTQEYDDSGNVVKETMAPATAKKSGGKK
ncbi:MAG: toxin-antitoxin system YwqK family antitoxin [Chitinophagales bacterium]